jgi:phage baseplate assembly protein W
VASIHYRSWRFAHLPFGAPSATGSGLRVGPTGAVEMVEDEAAIRQAILMLLSTTPGERIMRPDYGCRIHWLVFAPNDDTTAGLAVHYVTQALRRWEPRILLLRVDARRDPYNEGLLTVTLEYRVKSTQELNELIYPFRLDAGGVG